MQFHFFNFKTIYSIFIFYFFQCLQTNIHGSSPFIPRSNQQSQVYIELILPSLRNLEKYY